MRVIRKYYTKYKQVELITIICIYKLALSYTENEQGLRGKSTEKHIINNITHGNNFFFFLI